MTLAVVLINIKTMEGENNTGMQENKRKGGVEDSRRAFVFKCIFNQTIMDHDNGQ